MTRALHDHPWWNVSIVLKGGYLEWGKDRPPTWRRAGSMVFRRATCAHRLTLGASGTPAWSLFITGPKVREWEFQCPQGWRHHEEFCAPDDSGRVGKGCE